jgi:hypothetical protein
MIKQSGEYRDHGWEALRRMLKDKGLRDCEIEEAELSFRNGITVLSKMFIMTRSKQRKDCN